MLSEFGLMTERSVAKIITDKADAPNKKRISTMSVIHSPAGKVKLSPVVDCLGGLVVSWSMSTHPNVELLSAMLDIATDKLGEGETKSSI